MQQQYLPQLPSKPGVYVFKNSKDIPVYIGKARDLKKRVTSYFAKNSLNAKALDITKSSEKLDFIVVGSEFEAYLLEASLVKKFQPYFNVKLTDDSSYPYVKITRFPNAYISITRKRDEKNAEYFGPFPDVKSLKIVLRTIRKIFPYQSVKNHPKRKCLYNHLSLCPCTPVNEGQIPEYKKNITRIRQIFKGNITSVISRLEKEREEHVRLEEFEKAGDIQKKIEKLHLITSEQYSPFHYEQRPDFYYERIQGELNSLATLLNGFYEFKTPVKRIECYDISNFSGRQATGSMVVFVNGDSDKTQYRKFRIQSKNTPDDFEMMREVLRRRLRNDWEIPDLIVVDGGKGQVSAALQVLVEKGRKIPLIGLAKKKEIIIVPQKNAGRMEFVELDFPNDTPGINLLRRLRNEAHRFAITYHRNLRKKQLLDI